MLSFFIFIKLTLPSAVPSRVQDALRFHRPRLPRLQTRCRQELHHQSNPFSPPGRWPPSADPPVHLQLLWSAYRSECIRRSIKRICTVQQRFHLPAHLIIINWRYKHNDIGAPHIFRQRERIVSITQWWSFWQARHPLTKGNWLSAQGSCLHSMPCAFGAFRKRIGKRFGIAPIPQTCGKNQNLFGHFKPSISVLFSFIFDCIP